MESIWLILLERGFFIHLAFGKSFVGNVGQSADNDNDWQGGAGDNVDVE